MTPNLKPISYILQVSRPFWGKISGQFAMATIWGLLLSLQPYYLKEMVNAANAGFSNSFGNVDIATPAIYYVITALVFNISYRFFYWLQLHYAPLLRYRVSHTLTEYLFAHAYTFYQNHLGGGLGNRVTECAVRIPNMIIIFIKRIFASIMALGIALYTIQTVSPKFAIGFFIWIVIFFGCSWFFGGKAVKYTTKAAESSSKIVGLIVDGFSNILNVKLFNGFRHEIETQHTHQKEHLEHFRAREWFILKIEALQGLSFTVFQAVCIWWLVEGAMEGSITAGDFALVITLNVNMVETFWQLTQDFRVFTEDYGYVEEALKIITIPHAIVDVENATPLKIKKGTIEIRNMTFGYKGIEPLFKDISLHIPAGQKVGMVGFSGSGKTTFVNLILRLFEIQNGEILIDGQNIQSVSQASLHHFISFIPQEPTLFHRSLRENILYGRPNATEKELIAASKQAHCHEFISMQEHGYDALVGERGIKLSGGQRQRIAIARAILKNAPILILDEATSALDSVTEKKIQDSLSGLMKGKTALVIAHRLSTLLTMDRILVFDKGRLIEDGTHKQLMAAKGHYAKLWEMQAGGFIWDTPEI
jgi:ATP-binding cassette, subfamily B, bacterial